MNAVDTNVLVRFLTRDDVVQADLATEAIRGGPIWISKTVLLETERVLRYTYGFPKAAVHDAFAGLLGLAELDVEDESTVVRAMGWFESGMDFADALHLASCPPEVAGFLTFDRKLESRADRLGEGPVPRLLGGAEGPR